MRHDLSFFVCSSLETRKGDNAGDNAERDAKIQRSKCDSEDGMVVEEV